MSADFVQSLSAALDESSESVKALSAALTAASEHAKTHGERLVSESEQIYALGEKLLAQAAQLRAGAAALNVPQEAEAAVVSEPPPPPPPVVKSDEPRSVGKGGAVVTLSVARAKMRELGRASRFTLARELGLTPIAVSRWLREMQAEGTATTEGAEFVYVEPSEVTEPTEPTEPPPDEGIPEELRMFPAARGSGGGQRKLAAAREQQAVYNVVTDGRPDVIASEIADVTHQTTERISTYLRELTEAGLIRRTGRNRFRHDRPRGKPGRASVEFAPLTRTDQQRIAPPEPSVTAVEPREDVHPEPSVNDVRVVRDEVKKQLSMFSPAQIADATDLDKDVVLGCLRELERHGIVHDESPAPDLPLFRHTPNRVAPTVQKVTSKPRRGSTTPIETKRGEVVSGTGQKLKAAHKEVQELIDACVRAGAQVTHATSGHFAVQPMENGSPRGKRILIAGTPRGTRTVMNDRARLRRAGLAV